MTTHAEARQLATVALQRRFGVNPTPGEVKALAGVGWLETNYGDGWKGDGAGSHNIGAIHADKTWSGESFTHTDSHSDGSTYETKFRAYPTALAGWVDFVGVAFVEKNRAAVRVAARAQDWRGVSAALYQTGYYEGFGDTADERIANHVKALTRAITAADGSSSEMDAATTITIRVENPQGERIGITSISDLQAPGLSILAGTYGAPVMVAYPNGWRFVKFTPDVQIVALSNHPYTLVQDEKPASFGWEHGAFVLGVASLAATMFFGTLSIKPGAKHHARAA